MKIRKIRKQLQIQLKQLLDKRKPMLPRKDGRLDLSLIKFIVIHLDANGKPYLVSAILHDGSACFEAYSAALNSLILSSGIPWNYQAVLDAPTDEETDDPENETPRP